MTDPLPHAPAADDPWWSRDAPQLLRELDSRPQGLSDDEARERLARFGPNRLVEDAEAGAWRVFARQFASPLVLILVVASVLSMLLRDWVDAGTVLVILLGSAALGFWQEWRASQAVAQLRSRLALDTRVRRGGQVREIAAAELVPGDVIELKPGQLVPADGCVVESLDCRVMQASLTGEPFPVAKRPGVAAADAPLGARDNAVWLGSSVRSGSAAVLVLRTGHATLMAGVAARIAARQDETEFERGVRRFGELLTRVMI
ncbi:MAG: cation-transporting P-type ATPase, partial [Rubrivivax sp.]